LLTTWLTADPTKPASSPDPFLADLDDLFKVVDSSARRTDDIALLLNYALIRPEPVA
jgi:hypothetical protein